jgi:hypothetical protein
MLGYIVGRWRGTVVNEVARRAQTLQNSTDPWLAFSQAKTRADIHVRPCPLPGLHQGRATHLTDRCSSAFIQHRCAVHVTTVREIMLLRQNPVCPSAVPQIRQMSIVTGRAKATQAMANASRCRCAQFHPPCTVVLRGLHIRYGGIRQGTKH